MSESSNEQSDDGDGVGISDEQLPEDLQASEDNPLAEPLTDEDAPEDMDDLDMMGGGSSGDSGDSGGSGDAGGSGESPSDDDDD